MKLWITKFLKRATNIVRTVVKGKRVNRGAGYVLEMFYRKRIPSGD